MTIKELHIEKSLTLGVATSERTKYRKITISSTAELSEADDYDACYKQLSDKLEAKITYERELFVSNK